MITKITNISRYTAKQYKFIELLLSQLTTLGHNMDNVIAQCNDYNGNVIDLLLSIRKIKVKIDNTDKLNDDIASLLHDL